MGKDLTGSSAPSAPAGAVAPSSASSFAFGIPLRGFLLPFFLILIFFAEAITPLHMNLPIVYIAVLVLIVSLAGIREKILIAATGTTLMIVDFFLSLSTSAALPWITAIHDGVAIIMTWVVGGLSIRHKLVDESMRKNERVANERLALINTIYASAPVGLCFLDREKRYVSVNDAFAEMIDRLPDHFLGKTVGETIRELGDGIETHFERVISTLQPVIDVEVSGAFNYESRERRHWLCSFYPVQTPAGELLGVNVAASDITRRKQAESDTLFLLDLGECIRFATSADELLWAVAVALGEHLRVHRCAFVEVDLRRDRLAVQRDYHPHIASIAGEYRLRDFGLVIEPGDGYWQICVINDTAADRRTAKHLDTYRKLGIGALIVTPLLRDNELVSALGVAMAEPRDWSEREITLVNAVAERTWLAVEKLRLDNILRETDKALRDADRRKDEFLATLAHELRNPLSLIRNVVTLQKAADASDYDKHWGQDIIDRQVNYLTRLTDDLFDVSRITRDKLVLQKEPVNLAEVIDAAVESSKGLIDQRQHRLSVKMPDAAIMVDADRVRMTQVFMNLLNNAAKYSPEPGDIHLLVEVRNHTVTVRVKDTGAGIAAENLPHVFDLFYQVDRSYTRAEGGLGLGLTLVRRLVQMHGGEVEVRSEGLGRGSEFLVRLPMLAPREVGGEQMLEKRDPHESNVSTPRRILVVDDFPESAATLARLLQQDGNTVRIAEDGIEALDVAEHFHPDVILLDIAMPKLNGYDTARRIRERPWGKRVALIALTGWGQKQDRQRTRAAGFDAHLTKPVHYDAIMNVLATLYAGGPGPSSEQFCAEASEKQLSPRLTVVK